METRGNVYCAILQQLHNFRTGAGLSMGRVISMQRKFPTSNLETQLQVMQLETC